MATNNAINLAGPTPAFSAVLSSNHTGTNAYQVIFDTVLVDTTSSYNNGTGVYTIPTSGIYLLSSHITYGQYSINATTFIFIYMSINGIPYQFGLMPGIASCPGYAGPNNWLAFDCNIILPLTSGNNIFVSVNGTGNTSNDNVVGYSPATSYTTCFSGYMIAQV